METNSLNNLEPASLGPEFELMPKELGFVHSRVVNVARKQPCEIYVGRTLRGHTSTGWHNTHTMAGNSLKSRLTAVTRYFDGLVLDAQLMGRLEELKGKSLGCWCAPKLCHGHVLAAMSENYWGACAKWVNSLKTLESSLEFRLLVTGSRTFTDKDLIQKSFAKQWEVFGKPKSITLVVGDAKGADKIAQELWRQVGWKVEEHKANWDEQGNAAGMRRNLAMIASGVDACLAFADGDTPGTQGCLAAARKAYIPCVEIRK